MLRNYIKTAIRALLKDRLYAFVNVLGLATAIATLFVLTSWIQFETSYDRHLPESDRIFRVATQWDNEGAGYATTYPMMTTQVLNQFPEVEHALRIHDAGFLGTLARINYEDRVFLGNKLYYADSSFFKLFPFQIVSGNELTAFQFPNSTVLTESVAKKFFGSSDAVGKIIQLDGTKELVVSAVIRDIPENTHFRFDLLVNMQSHPWVSRAALWSGIVFNTYIKVKPGTNPINLQRKISDYLDQMPNDPEHHGRELNMVLQPLSDIHLRSHLKFELGTNGNIYYVYVFAFIGLLILIVAVINYVNLALARYTQRTKEVAVRKVMGAQRVNLITQFLIESLAMVFASVLVAIVIISAVSPVLLELTSTNFLQPLFEINTWLGFGGAVLVISLLTGIAPALAASAFNPARLFKSMHQTMKLGVRNTLMSFQFAVSVILCICTAFTYQQLKFVQEKPVGYDKEQIVVVPISYREVLPKYELLKNRLLQHSDVLGATACSQLPTHIVTAENIDVSGNEPQGVYYISVDKDFFKTLSIGIDEGEANISQLDTGHYANRYVLNQQAVDLYGWTPEAATTQSLTIRHGNMQPGPIIGVVNDFHFQSLHNPLAPLVFEFTPDSYEYLLVKVRTTDMENTLKQLQQSWQQVAGAIPFDYHFLDQEYAALYKDDQRVGKLFLVFTCIASLIALLGLFALASFAAVRRTKEISIRRVLGASAFAVVRLLSKDFIWLLIVAVLIAVPAGYWIVAQWLQSFAFKVELSALVFVVAVALNILLAAVTLFYHGWKAGRANPVETLKNE